MEIKDKKYLENLLLKYQIPSEIEDPHLIKSYSELIDLLNYIPKESHLKFLYSNRNNIKKILYDEDKILKLNKDVINNDNYIHNYFYLYEIIGDDYIDIINYGYDFDLINILNERMKAEAHNLKKFILYIFAYTILNNYREGDDYSSSDEDKCNTICKEIDEFMINQQPILDEFNLNLDLLNYKSFKIDNIYAEVIISLIKNKKLENYEYSKNIMEQLDIENIELTKEMFISLKKEFDENLGEEYIKCYNITNNFNENHINFYYTLFKYVFKISYYIYQIQFFLNAQKSLKAIIKNNDKILSDIKSNERKEFVLAIFLDSDYDFIKNKYEYETKKDNYFSNPSTEISISRSTTLTSTTITTTINTNTNTNTINNNNDTSLTNESSRKKKKEKRKKKNYVTENSEKTEEEKEKKKEKLNLVDVTMKINYKPNKEEQKEIIELVENEKYYYSFNYFNYHKKDFSEDTNSDEYKIYEYLSEFFDILKNEYKNNSELVIEMSIKKNCNDLEFIYNYNSHFYKDINNISEETIQYFIDEINSKKYSLKKEKKSKKSKIEKTKKKTKKNKNLEETGNRLKISRKIKYHKYKILYFKKVIGNHNEIGGHNSAKFIKELNHIDKRYISGGTDKALRIYKSNFSEFYDKIELPSEISDNVFQIINKKNQNELNEDLSFFVCTKKDLILYDFDNTKSIFKSRFILSIIDDITCNSFLKIKSETDESIIIAGKGGALRINNINKILNNNGSADRYKILKDIEYMGIIQINKKWIALTSNSNLPRGEDKLVLYNIETSRKEEINKYSFIISSNGLAVLIPESKKIENERYLICACKKYIEDQKNGILFINTSNDEFKYSFYNTEDFEVYCFCQIKERLQQVDSEINDIEEPTTPTDFFLVGGFDPTRGEGLIKLYKLFDNEDTKQKDIKFLQDIEFKKYAKPEKEEAFKENQESKDMDETMLTNTQSQTGTNILVDNESFEGFKGAISSIIQSTSTGNILVSCYDGKISLLSKINLELYGKELNFV